MKKTRKELEKEMIQEYKNSAMPTLVNVIITLAGVIVGIISICICIYFFVYAIFALIGKLPIE